MSFAHTRWLSFWKRGDRRATWSRRRCSLRNRSSDRWASTRRIKVLFLKSKQSVFVSAETSESTDRRTGQATNVPKRFHSRIDRLPARAATRTFDFFIDRRRRKRRSTYDRNTNVAVLLDVRMPNFRDKFLKRENIRTDFVVSLRTIFGGLIGYSLGKSRRALKNPPGQRESRGESGEIRSSTFVESVGRPDENDVPSERIRLLDQPGADSFDRMAIKLA